MAEPQYYEEQKFPHARLRILTAIPPAAMTLLAIWQVGLGHAWGKQPMSNTSVIGWTIFLWLIYLRLITVKLVTELFPGELRVAMRGLWRSAKISLKHVKSVGVLRFDPTADWGGYGVRRGSRGTAYIAAGNEGVELQMIDGSIVLVGSGNAAALASAISRQLPHN